MISTDLEDLFIKKLALVNGLLDCVNYAVQSQLSQSDGALDEKTEVLISALKSLALHVEADGAHRFSQGVEPIYHNRQHIVEVVISMLMLLEAQAHQFEICLDLKQRLLLIAAAIGHDYLHDGGINQSIDDEETLSANAVKAILLESGASASDAEYVHELIMATARTNVVNNHALAKASLDAKLLAKLLMSEADIFASLMPVYGIQKGKKLSEENLRAGVPNASIIAMPQGRQWFLKNSFISSPHAKALGLDLLVRQQID